VPIGIGDLLGLDYNSSTNWYFRLGGGPASGRLFNPALAQGSTRTPQSDTTEELLLNADIEPTSALAQVTAKAKRKGRVRVSMEVPNPGALLAGDKADAGVKAARAAKKKKKKKKKKTRLLKRARAQVAAPGAQILFVKPTKAARAALARGKRPKAKLKLVFTPTGGSPSTRIVKVRLKR
jgi:hypothetical protein